MTGRETDQAEERLTLESRRSDIAKLPSWIGSLALRHAIPESVEFAINLCLEEAVSNVILHGYGADASGPVIVRFVTPRKDFFVFIIEDEARRFNPLDVPAPDPSGKVRVGGQGIHFLREFAQGLEYEPTPTGNRLSIVFSAASSHI
jgi:anti-sigma regulatory factor (Ser/Thr protein kinase)